MSQRNYHIASTEARTLCGLPPSSSRIREVPWAEWIAQYQVDPLTTCAQCRRYALQYRDRSLAIRAADRNTGRSEDAEEDASA